MRAVGSSRDSSRHRSLDDLTVHIPRYTMQRYRGYETLPSPNQSKPKRRPPLSILYAPPKSPPNSKKSRVRGAQMSSWLARSLAASLNLPDDSAGPSDLINPDDPDDRPAAVGSVAGRPADGVKEDLSELSQTLSRHFKGVASFLAPPPPPAPPSDQDLEEEGEEEEVGVSGYYDAGFDAVGVTEEVLAFARNISMHPETWLDFPLLPDEDEPDSLFSYFDMSDAQIEHAMALERLAPRLAALRIELCPIHMSEDTFWKIYFVLLHPRLSKHDADLLSTPQIVEARAMLMQCLQSKSKPESERQTKSYYASEPDATGFTSDIDTDKHPILSTEMQVVDKCIIQEEPSWDRQPNNIVSDSHTLPLQNFDDEVDSDEDWFNKETELQENITTIHVGTEDDVSFSDLEDDDYCKK